MPRAVILDVDGTLVDSVYHHALCWHRAFARFEIEVPVWRCHRHIGMGGDQLVPAIAGEKVERELGPALREAESELFADMIDEVRPLDGAAQLIDALAEGGWRIVLASSAQTEEVERHIAALGADGKIADFTTGSDVESTKPHPEMVSIALEKAGTEDAVMVGDSVWDVRAADRAGAHCVGLLTGGFSEAELLEAGAVRVYESPRELATHLPESLEP